MSRWAGPDSEIAEFIARKREECLHVYRISQARLVEDAKSELAVIEGGYGHRQLFELIQNGADAILEGGGHRSSRIEVVLTDSALYCANTGSPIGEAGVNAILHSHLSTKRGAEIGHFGLGFKSVLAISATPQFFCRTVSFGFDVGRSADVIRHSQEEAGLAVPPPDANMPGLRIAFPLDPVVESESDPTLREMMAWATTVVRLPRNAARARELSQDLSDFPARFLLFSPHVSQLVLRDETTGQVREIRAALDESGVILLSDAGQTTRWKVFRVNHEPTVEARADGGDIAGRETVPVAWASPVDRRRGERGQFWAFFPTTYESTVDGIVNAAWKTNADRQGLLEGPYNRELIDVAAQLIASSIPKMFNPADAGEILDRLPARDKLGWADGALSDALFRALSRVRCVPDSDGDLRLAHVLRSLPYEIPDEVLDQTLAAWDGLPDRPKGWVHATTLTRERRVRVQRLGVPSSTVREWLQAIAKGGDVAGSIAALKVAAAMIPKLGRSATGGVSEAAIVLCMDGQMRQPDPTQCFLGTSDVPAEGQRVVHQAVQANHAAREALERLGFRTASVYDRLRQLPEAPAGPGSYWPTFWRVAGGADFRSVDGRAFLVEFRERLRLRTLDGNFVPPYALLIPGAVVPEDGSRDAMIALDVSFHAPALEVLTEVLSLVESPVAGGLKESEPFLRTYRQQCEQRYRESLPPNAPKPGANSLIMPCSHAAGPVSALRPDLSQEGKYRLTKALAPLADAEPSWEMSHRTRKASYPTVQFASAAQAVIRSRGVLATSQGLQSVGACVGSGLSRFRTLLPVAIAAPSFLSLPESLTALPADMIEKGLALTLECGDAEVAAAFYVEACDLIAKPDHVLAYRGEMLASCATADVRLVSTADTADALRQLGVPTLIVRDDVAKARLLEHWGMSDGSSETVFELGASGRMDPIALADLIPELSADALAVQGARLCVACRDIWHDHRSEAGVSRVPSDGGVARDGTFLFRDSLDRSQLVSLAARLLGISVMVAAETNDVDSDLVGPPQVVRSVREASDTAERLLRASGRDVLLEILPAAVKTGLEATIGELTDIDVARAALAVHGTATLERAVAGLDANGLRPPRRWAGGTRALEFVAALGFPPEFAGERSSAIPPWFEVDGPQQLPALHPFQEKVAGVLREFIVESRPSRGLLSLPTGAGKTRVVVESLVRCIKDGTLAGTILWIADRQELCEQAVASWGEVWRALGSNGPLRISRFWGGTNSRVVATDAHVNHVVVATYQSLSSRWTQGHGNWMLDPSVVVVDEAHGSVATVFTSILALLGLDSKQTARPLIGLSATPFRGRLGTDEETERLVRRYGGRRFDRGVFPDDDPYPELRRLGVLAAVEWDLLDGANLNLTAEERLHVDTYRVLPSSAEARLGLMRERNDVLVERILAMPPNWPVLVFATSVDHAELLASLLASRGVRAQAISSRTEDHARRRAISAFKSGEVQVLANYGVLTTGFDAPRTRAIVVARPVFAPGLYQQMIGRGLRGPLNGGTDVCLIVNVKDTVAQFGEQLAFQEFEDIWRAPSDVEAAHE